MKKLTRRHWLMIALILLLCALTKLGLLYYWAQQQTKNNETPTQNAPAAIQEINDCDLQEKKCHLPNGDSIAFVGLVSLKAPFDIVYQSPRPITGNISIEISMLSMDMGVSRYLFMPSDTPEQQIVKTIRLPVCPMGGRDYIAVVNIADQHYQIPLQAWLGD